MLWRLTLTFEKEEFTLQTLETRQSREFIQMALENKYWYDMMFMVWRGWLLTGSGGKSSGICCGLNNILSAMLESSSSFFFQENVLAGSYKQADVCVRVRWYQQENYIAKGHFRPQSHCCSPWHWVRNLVFT